MVEHELDHIDLYLEVSNEKLRQAFADVVLQGKIAHYSSFALEGCTSTTHMFGLNGEEIMDILHIAGVADKSTMNPPESVKASRHSFKAEGNFPTNVLQHDDYERQSFSAERRHPAPRRRVQVMIQVGMPESVASVMVGAHFGGAAVAEVEEPN